MKPSFKTDRAPLWLNSNWDAEAHWFCSCSISLSLGIGLSLITSGQQKLLELKKSDSKHSQLSMLRQRIFNPELQGQFASHATNPTSTLPYPSEKIWKYLFAMIKPLLKDLNGAFEIKVPSASMKSSTLHTIQTYRHSFLAFLTRFSCIWMPRSGLHLSKKKVSPDRKIEAWNQ